MLLRISVSHESQDQFRVKTHIESDGIELLTRARSMLFHMSSADWADLRWYWEQYADSPFASVAEMADRIEKRMRDIGAHLFRAAFEAGPEEAQTQSAINSNLTELRVEIEAGDLASGLLPWELMRLPDGRALALEAREFVRLRQVQSSGVARLPVAPRVLIVISRPEQGRDVSYRSVAKQVIGQLKQTHEPIMLSVLRPPTFNHFKSVLKRYYDDGEPFDLVHFDCHGDFLDDASASHVETLSRPSGGPRGYLLFEKDLLDRKNQELQTGAVYVNGSELSDALVSAGVRAVVLNACRSAYFDAGATSGPTSFGSLADELVTGGIDCVVAMRYSVYVDSAANFMRTLYQRIIRGNTLSTAATKARKKAAESGAVSIREGRRLEDWPVPVVVERAPLQLVQSIEAGSDEGTAEWHSTASAGEPLGITESRDQESVVLFLDRLFGFTHRIVVNGLIGSGKSTLASLAAAWLRESAGTFHVIQSSAGDRLSVARLAGDAATALVRELAEAGFEWQALPDQVSQMSALRKVMSETLVLWIWDGIDELIAGWRGEPSSYTAAEAIELRDFVEYFDSPFTKWIFTCRSGGRDWIGPRAADLVATGLSTEDAIRLFNDLAAVRLSMADAVDLWQAAAEWSAGNPQAIHAASKALRNLSNLSPTRVRGFIEALWRGHPSGIGSEDLAVLTTAARSVSKRKPVIGAKHGLGILRNLARYRGPVSAFIMPPGVALHPESLEQWTGVLDECAEAGLAFRDGSIWRLHPLFPCAVRSLFADLPPEEEKQELDAYLQGVADGADLLNDGYRRGKRDMAEVAWLMRHDFEHALKEALALSRWSKAVLLLQGLRLAYAELKGDHDRWTSILDGVMPDFIGEHTFELRTGREEQAAFVLHMRATSLLATQRPNEAAPLLKEVVEYHRSQVQLFVRRKPNTWNKDERQKCKWLTGALLDSGVALLLTKDPACFEVFEEAGRFAKAADRASSAPVNLNLGIAYMSVKTPPDLRRAETHLKQSLGERTEGDNLGKGRCYLQLGLLHLQRWSRSPGLRQESPDSRPRSRGEAESWLNRATRDLRKGIRYLETAAQMLPLKPHMELYGAHYYAAQALFRLYRITDWREELLDAALSHYTNSTEIIEALRNDTQAAATRFEIASDFFSVNRLGTARDFAVAALASYQALPEETLPKQIEVLRLLSQIDEATAANRAG